MRVIVACSGPDKVEPYIHGVPAILAEEKNIAPRIFHAQVRRGDLVLIHREQHFKQVFLPEDTIVYGSIYGKHI